MGISGTGNFDSDAALDFVYSMVETVRESLHVSEFEDIAMTMGAVEVYKTMVEHCCATPPDRTEIESLRDKTLAVYDDEKDAFTTDSNREHITQRRAVIANTFDQFLLLCGED